MNETAQDDVSFDQPESTNSSEPHVDVSTPGKATKVALAFGVFVVMAVLGILVFIFRNNLKTLLSPSTNTEQVVSETPIYLDEAAESTHSIKTPKVAETLQKYKIDQSAIPKLEELRECLRNYNLLLPKDNPIFANDANNIGGMLASVDVESRKVTFHKSTGVYDLSDVEGVMLTYKIGSGDTISYINKKLPYSIDQIIPLLDEGYTLTIFKEEGKLVGLSLTCHAK